MKQSVAGPGIDDAGLHGRVSSVLDDLEGGLGPGVRQGLRGLDQTDHVMTAVDDDRGDLTDEVVAQEPVAGSRKLPCTK